MMKNSKPKQRVTIKRQTLSQTLVKKISIFFAVSLQNMRRKRRLHYIHKHKNNQFMVTVKKFSATWCMPCRQMVPVFEEVKKKIQMYVL